MALCHYGDGQYDVDELATLLPLLTDDVDIVNGYKRKRADKADRVVLGGIYKLLARILFKLPIRDVDCDFRLLRRSAIQSIELHSDSGCICTEVDACRQSQPFSAKMCFRWAAGRRY